MDKIKFSVVMPNYNKGAYIADSIESVLQQDFKEFELIIVDDGSTDNSLRVISKFKDKRIRIISQANSGVSVARNNGIKSAQYDYIAFLDSDDIWLPWFLTEISHMIRKYPNAGAYGCSCNYIACTKEYVEELVKQKKYDKSCYRVIDNYFDVLLKGEGSLTASSSIVNKRVFEQCGMFPEGLKQWEDYDMWIRIGLFYDIIYNNKVSVIYNAVANSASSNKSDLHAPVFSQYKLYLKKSGIKGKKRKDFIKLVATKEAHAAYERFLFDRDKKVALKRIAPFWKIEFFNKLYWSEVLQIITSPELLKKIYIIKSKALKNKNGII